MNTSVIMAFNHAVHDQKTHGRRATAIAKGLGFGMRDEKGSTGFMLQGEFGKTEISLVQRKSRMKGDYAYAQTYVKQNPSKAVLAKAMKKLTEHGRIVKAKEDWARYNKKLEKAAKEAANINTEDIFVNHGDHDQKSHGSWAGKGAKGKGKEATGDCYEAACRSFAISIDVPEKLEEVVKNPDARLVQAEVRGQGKLEGIRFGHAWIEDKTTVYDFSNGRELIMPKGLYYAIGDIKEVKGKRHEYNKSQARKMAVTKGNFGPWELDTKF